VTVGIIAMLIVLGVSMRTQLTEKFRTGVELVGWYWHFVDAVWIVVFLVVYVASRSGGA
jgi:heme/copper-type cytochrome/quinol oxidase subunit 3